MIDPKYFVKLQNDVWASPVWAGKFPAQAWRVYCWLLDKTTKQKTANGIVYGLVLGRAPVSYGSIAKALGCSWRSVQRGVLWLRKKNLIIATRAGAGEQYRYMIPNCSKYGDGKVPAASEHDAAMPAPDDVDFRAEPKADAVEYDLSGLED